MYSFVIHRWLGFCCGGGDGDASLETTSLWTSGIHGTCAENYSSNSIPTFYRQKNNDSIVMWHHQSPAHLCQNLDQKPYPLDFCSHIIPTGHSFSPFLPNSILSTHLSSLHQESPICPSLFLRLQEKSSALEYKEIWNQKDLGSNPNSLT